MPNLWVPDRRGGTHLPGLDNPNRGLANMHAHSVSLSPVSSSSSQSAARETSSRFAGPWGCVPLVVFQAGLSRSAVQVYGVLSMHAGNTDLCWPSLRRIAELLGMDRAQVCRALDELESKGFLRRFRSRGGLQGHTRYLLLLPGEKEETKTERNPAPTGGDCTVTPPGDSTVTLKEQDKKSENKTTTPTPPPRPEVAPSPVPEVSAPVPVAEPTVPLSDPSDTRGGGDVKSISPDGPPSNRRVVAVVSADTGSVEPAPERPASSAASDLAPEIVPSAPAVPEKLSAVVDPVVPTPGLSVTQDEDALIFPEKLSPAQQLAVATLLSLIPAPYAQQILDELAGKMLCFEVYNPVGFLRALVRHWREGTFTPELALEVAQRRTDRRRRDRIRVATERVMRARLEGTSSGSSGTRAPAVKPVAHLQAMRRALGLG